MGDKCSYADLSFVTWSAVGEGLLKQLGRMEEFGERFPRYVGWLEMMGRRDDVREIQERMARGRAEHGLP